MRCVGVVPGVSTARLTRSGPSLPVCRQPPRCQTCKKLLCDSQGACGTDWSCAHYTNRERRSASLYFFLLFLRLEFMIECKNNDIAINLTEGKYQPGATQGNCAGILGVSCAYVLVQYSLKHQWVLTLDLLFSVICLLLVEIIESQLLIWISSSILSSCDTSIHLQRKVLVVILTKYSQSSLRRVEIGRKS